VFDSGETQDCSHCPPNGQNPAAGPSRRLGGVDPELKSGRRQCVLLTQDDVIVSCSVQWQRARPLVDKGIRSAAGQSRQTVSGGAGPAISISTPPETFDSERIPSSGLANRCISTRELTGLRGCPSLCLSLATRVELLPASVLLEETVPKEDGDHCPDLRVSKNLMEP
jgi:hypothetical protein